MQENWIIDFFPPGITFFPQPQLVKIEHGHLIYGKLLKLIYYTFWACWVVSVGWCITIVHMLVVNYVLWDIQQINIRNCNISVPQKQEHGSCYLVVTVMSQRDRAEEQLVLYLA